MVTAAPASHPVYDRVAADIAAGRHAYLTTADTAKLVRSTLAARFPGVRFYVRSSTYAGGSSIRVAWDGVVLDAKGWPVRVLVDYDGNVLDPTPVPDPDYTRGGRYGYLPKPGAPLARDVDAVLAGFAGKGFDGSIDLGYYKRSWLNPDGSMTFASTDGTAGSMGYVPARDGSRTHPSALLVSPGADYVTADPFLPYDKRTAS